MYKDSVDLPIGFVMSLAMNAEAMKNYSSLTNDKQQEIHSYIQDTSIGIDVKERIDDIISKLENNEM